MKWNKLGVFILVLFIISCAARQWELDLSQAQSSQQWDKVVSLVEAQLKKKPNDESLLAMLRQSKTRAREYHKTRFYFFLNGEYVKEAEFSLQLVRNYGEEDESYLQLERQLAQKKLRIMNRKKKSKTKTVEAPLVEGPQLDDNGKLIDLDFKKPISMGDLYRAVGSMAGINVLIDSKMGVDKKTTIELSGVNLMQCLDYLTMANHHIYRVLDPKTVIIYQDTAQNRNTFAPAFIQTFYLSNANPETVRDLIKQVLKRGTINKASDIVINKDLNAITVKGSIEDLKMIEAVIKRNDKPKSEVMVEIKILEVTRSNMEKVGLLPVYGKTDSSGNVDFSSVVPGYSGGGFLKPPESDGPFRLNRHDWSWVVPSLMVDFLEQMNGSHQLAQPQIRISDGETGETMVGQRLAVINTQFSSLGGGENSSTQGLASSSEYKDVGVKIIVTPRVHHNSEVTLKVDLEITSVISAGIQPIFGVRKVTTQLRLRDGEVNMIAGLLKKDEQRTIQGVAGLRKIPILGKLFDHKDMSGNETDVIITISPRIIKGPSIELEDREIFHPDAFRQAAKVSKVKQLDTVSNPAAGDNNDVSMASSEAMPLCMMSPFKIK